jgi:hypothetical protein
LLLVYDIVGGLSRLFTTENIAAFQALFCIIWRILVAVSAFKGKQISGIEPLCGVTNNGRPRRRLGYQTPEELFDAFLDALYAA